MPKKSNVATSKTLKSADEVEQAKPPIVLNNDEIMRLGVSQKLSNCELVRLDLDDEHFYFIYNDEFPKGKFCVSVTKLLDEAGPVPFGLREFWKQNSKQDSEEILNVTGERGKRLHQALEDLMEGLEVDLKQFHQNVFEKDAITTFIRVFRFLQPAQYKKEKAVASPSLGVAGTLDFVGRVDPVRLQMLQEPTKYLDLDPVTQEIVVKEKHLDMLKGIRMPIKVVIDWKFTAGIRYSHHKQVIFYRNAYNESYASEPNVTHCFIWRYSNRHKFGFELQEVTGDFDSFLNLYRTYLDINGGLPEPPVIRTYPDKVRLLEKIKAQAKEDAV